MEITSNKCLYADRPEKVRRTVVELPPEEKQRRACGNTMRAMLRQRGIDIHRATLRPRLDKILQEFPFKGDDKSRARFIKKIEQTLKPYPKL